MCIAATIFNKVPLNYLESMHEDNPDGGGVAWYENGRIQFARGLDARQIFAMQESGEIKLPYLLHFRWATHGQSVPQLTHPFPIGPRALFGELRGECDRVLIHNGTWGGFEKAIPNEPMEFPEELLAYQSDTAIAAWLADHDESILALVPWATAVAFVSNGEMDVTTRGRWYDKDGNWYSNLTWVPYEKSTNYYAKGGYTGPGDTGTYHFNPGKTHTQSTNWEEWAAKYKVARPTPSGPPDRADYSKEDSDRETWLNGYERGMTDTEKLAELARKHEARRDVIKQKWEAREGMSWDDYLRIKYGSKAGTVRDAYGHDDTQVPDADVVSEDHEIVNSILARNMIR